MILVVVSAWLKGELPPITIAEAASLVRDGGIVTAREIIDVEYGS